MIKWRPSQKWIVFFLLFPVWMLGMYFVVEKNPTDSEEKLARMRFEVANLLQIGGDVVERKENAKYGGAYLILLMSDVGWSEELTRNYVALLIKNGWVKQEHLQEYCLNGVKLVITRNVGMKNGVGVNAIDLAYNSQTIKDCKVNEL